MKSAIVKLSWVALFFLFAPELSGHPVTGFSWLLVGVFGSGWLACAGVLLALLAVMLFGVSTTAFNMAIPALFAAGLVLRLRGCLVAPGWAESPLFQRWSLMLRRVFWAAELLLAGWLLLRTSTPPLGAGLLGLILLLHWSLPFPPVVTDLRAWAANTALVLLSVLFSLAMMEGVLRLHGEMRGTDGVMYRPHPVYHYLLNPGARVVCRVATSPGGFTDIHHVISSQGLRDREYPPKGEGERRVLLLGDSFTMGYSVGTGDTISGRLEALFAKKLPEQQITVINGGISGGGPFQELGMLRERGLPLEPDHVILQLYLPNDFDDCLAVVGKTKRAFFGGERRYFDALRRQNSLPDRLELWARENSAVYRATLRATGHGALLSGALRALRVTPAEKVFTARPLDPGLHMALDVNRVEWYPELEEGLQLLAGHVLEMAVACRENGAEFAVWCMPDSIEVDLERWDAVVESAPKDTGPFAPGAAIRRVEEVLARQGIRTFSVEGALRGANRPVGELYYLDDGHQTPEGSRIIAEALAEFLLPDMAARP